MGVFFYWVGAFLKGSSNFLDSFFRQLWSGSNLHHMSLVTPKTNLKLLHVCLNYQQTHNKKYTRTVKLSTKSWVMTVMSNILFTSAVWFICSAPEKKKNAFHLMFTLTYSKWTKRNGEGLIHWTFMQFIILLNHVCCYSTQYCGWPGSFDSSQSKSGYMDNCNRVQVKLRTNVKAT